jgi:hypothetical protein
VQSAIECNHCQLIQSAGDICGESGELKEAALCESGDPADFFFLPAPETLWLNAIDQRVKD